jgi:hypothetical protein
VAVKEKTSSKVFLYPNPVSKFLTIDLKGFNDKDKVVEINDMKGISMFNTQTVEKKMVVNVENYPTGLYILKVHSQNSTWSGKVFKN